MSGDHDKYHGTAEVLKDEVEEQMRYDEDYVAGLKARISELEAKLSKREWVGLTDDDIEEVISFPWHYIPFARAIEAKLKEKNA